MSPEKDILLFRASLVNVSFTIGLAQAQYQFLSLRTSHNPYRTVLIYKSKDLRKLQQNLFYRLPKYFVNNRIYRNKSGNLHKKRRLPL